VPDSELRVLRNRIEALEARIRELEKSLPRKDP
jgi:polyhydroxyalkanoate synthesis regulator phasin